VKPVAG
jgi:hypothetical protein